MTPWGGIVHEPGYVCCAFDVGRPESVQGRAEGVADVTTGVAFDWNSRTNCGSIAKLVVGHLVTQVWRDRAERQRTSLGEVISRLPAPHRDASLEDCLVHRTGLWDFRSLIPLFGHLSTRSFGLAEVMGMSARQNSVVAGFQHQYSNTNYLLLGLALERQTGRSLPELVRDFLGDEVGNFATHPRELIPGRARGYEARDGVLREVSAFVDGRGSTNFWASPMELARLTGRLLDDLGTLPAYGGFALDDSRFCSLGHDGGFQAGLLIDTARGGVHVALTNSPYLTAAELLQSQFDIGLMTDGDVHPTARPSSRQLLSEDREGAFTCVGLGVPISVSPASHDELRVTIGADYHVVKLRRQEDETFSDGHVTLMRRDALYLNINHAEGISLLAADQ